MEDKDFNDFVDLNIDSFVSISIELYGENLSCLPNLHALKTSDQTVRISYLYAHKSKLITTDETFERIEIILSYFVPCITKGFSFIISSILWTNFII